MPLRGRRRRGTEREDRAFYWYRRSAVGGNGSAMCNLAGAIKRGYGVEQNWQEAVKWYEQGAQCGNSGNPCIIWHAATEHGRRRGTKYDGSDPLVYCLPPRAEMLMTCMSSTGSNDHGGRRGTGYEKAIWLVRTSSRAEPSGAMNSLGECYADGMGRAAGFETAMEWYRAAELERSSPAGLQIWDGHLSRQEAV